MGTFRSYNTRTSYANSSDQTWCCNWFAFGRNVLQKVQKDTKTDTLDNDRNCGNRIRHARSYWNCYCSISAVEQDVSIPLWVGCLITIVDTFTFLFLDKYGLRKLEMLFAFLIGVMGVTFGYEYVVSQPPQGEVMKGLLAPWAHSYDSAVFLMAVGVIGAVIMPHNLYLHSALVKSRDIDRKKPEKLKEAKLYYFIESSLALICSLVINIFVVSVFAHGLFKKTNNELLQECKANNGDVYPMAKDVFEANDNLIDADIYKGGIFLGCTYGVAALYIWAIGILAAGQSSTMTGTYAGQFAMEGFLNLRWSRWKRVVFTRSIAMVPTFFTAFFSSLQELSNLNDFLNAVMMLQLPFAIIPTIAFTSDPKIMGRFVNGLASKVCSLVLGVIVVGINVFFVVTKLQELELQLIFIILIIILAVLYLLFVVYLTIHLYISFGNTSLEDYPFIQKYVMNELSVSAMHNEAL
ncbi:hypothetical protein WA026_005456 [Henosepilachna vigintioctopunctata]|uniref:Protein Malvolio n=1 Tax=Henosepilachna vigintioctopunctata TaxID=420089 RepID=A0AAW1TWG6_9CUCU